MNEFVKKLEKLFSSDCYEVRIDSDDDYVQVHLSDSHGNHLGHLAVQDFDIPEMDIYLGKDDTLKAYRSFSSQEDFWAYVKKLKMDLELLVRDSHHFKIATYKTVLGAKKIALIVPREQPLAVLGSLAEKPLFATMSKKERLFGS